MHCTYFTVIFSQFNNPNGFTIDIEKVSGLLYVMDSFALGCKLMYYCVVRILSTSARYHAISV